MHNTSDFLLKTNKAPSQNNVKIKFVCLLIHTLIISNFFEYFNIFSVLNFNENRFGTFKFLHACFSFCHIGWPLIAALGLLFQKKKTGIFSFLSAYYSIFNFLHVVSGGDNYRSLGNKKYIIKKVSLFALQYNFIYWSCILFNYFFQ